MKRINVPEEGIETLFGSYDENLKHLESLFNVRIRTQGHELLVEGESLNLDKVDRIIDQLSSLLRDGYKLSNADVKTASALVAENGAVDLRDHFLKGSVTAAGKRRVAPKTVNQRRYLDAIDALDAGRFALDEQLVPLGPDADIEQAFEMLEVLVVRAEQR
ncbi:MAG: hypothetical protein ACJ731_06915, partial [Vicinamibacterales bacterium]